MATRLNQEVELVNVKQLASAGGNTRLNQEVLLLSTNQLAAAGGNVRVNQEVMLLLTPANLQGSKVQVIGGPFQDAGGNVLSNGFLIFQLQHDAVASGTAQIVGNIGVRVPLDVNGYISGTVSGPAVFLWPNNVLLPAGGTYLVYAYNSSNQIAWDNPQVQTISNSPSPYNINAWVPGP